jgi:hypothetical protein
MAVEIDQNARLEALRLRKLKLQSDDTTTPNLLGPIAASNAEPAPSTKLCVTFADMLASRPRTSPAPRLKSSMLSRAPNANMAKT